MDLRTKLAIQIGSLLISNIELADQLEAMQERAKEQNEKFETSTKPPGDTAPGDLQSA